MRVRGLVRGMRIGLFGSYFPEFRRSGSATTTLSFLLAALDGVDRVIVFAQAGASLPRLAASKRPEIVSAWRADDPVSLVAAAVRMLWASRSLDVWVFNMYLTSFGARRASNAVGLLLPTVLALLARRPVVVYMHNFLETQDVRSLGYAPGAAAHAFLRFAEGALLALTVVVVPLQEMAAQLQRHYSARATPLFLPYMDAAYLVLARDRTLEPTPSPKEAAQRVRCPGILLFGSWGPQKDLEGALGALRHLKQAGRSFRVTVAGGANTGFPQYAEVLDRLSSEYQEQGFGFRRDVPDDAVLRLFSEHQVLVLPYVATGGQSGVMNLGTLAGQVVVAYDSPQLRETAELLGTDADFIPRGDHAALEAAIDRALRRVPVRGPTAADFEGALRATRRSVKQLYELLADVAPSAR